MIYKDVRINQTTPSDDFIRDNKQTLRIYDWLLKHDILAHDIPTSLSQVGTALRYSGHFSEEDAQKFLDFVKTHETTDIEFLEPYENVRADAMYKRPMSKAVIVGSYSRYPRSTINDQ